MARDDANGMSSVLPSRAVQPGTINTGRPHELDVFIAMADALGIDCHCANTHVLENAIWQVTYQPSELRHCFGKYGLMPDIRLLNKQTNRVMYFEVSYPEAEDFGASCFFGCAWVLKNCPGLTEASAGRDLRSTGLF